MLADRYAFINMAPLAGWLLTGLIAIVCLGQPSVVRTQEARVLETARQMQGTGLRGRLIPYINGHPRLQKPPLAYWLADLSYAIFGVSAAAGRLPFAVLGWLMAGLNYCIGAHYFSRRAGFIAMSGVLGCVIGARYGLLAETDVLSAFWGTAATWAFWRAVDSPNAFGRCAGWLHAASIAIGLAVLSKGPPAAFPFLFFVAYVAFTRRWHILWWWIKSAAPLSAALIGAPWFIYIALTVGPDTIAYELEVAAQGGGHKGSFLNYFVYLVIDLLPLTAMAILGTWFASSRLRRDRRLAAIVLWILTILIPLCLAGQKQRHYLLPIIPPFMLLAGWYIDRALRCRPQSRHYRSIATMMTTLAIGLPVATVAIPIAGWIVRGRFDAMDALAAGLFAIAALLLYTTRKQSPLPATVIIFCLAMSPLVIFMQSAWASTLKPTTPQSIAADLDALYGNRPRCMIGRDQLQLQFHVRGMPDVLTTDAEIIAAITADPRTIFIEAVRNDDSIDPPAPLRLVKIWDQGKNDIYLYEVTATAESSDARANHSAIHAQRGPIGG